MAPSLWPRFRASMRWTNSPRTQPCRTGSLDSGPQEPDLVSFAQVGWRGVAPRQVEPQIGFAPPARAEGGTQKQRVLAGAGVARFLPVVAMDQKTITGIARLPQRRQEPAIGSIGIPIMGHRALQQRRGHSLVGLP